MVEQAPPPMVRSGFQTVGALPRPGVLLPARAPAILRAPIALEVVRGLAAVTLIRPRDEVAQRHGESISLTGSHRPRRRYRTKTSRR
jgi:hypothetical protein